MEITTLIVHKRPQRANDTGIRVGFPIVGSYDVYFRIAFFARARHKNVQLLETESQQDQIVTVVQYGQVCDCFAPV